MKTVRKFQLGQRRYFNKLVDLIGEDNLDPKDVIELQNAATCLFFIDQAEEKIKEHGAIQKFTNGTRNISPEFTMWKNAVTMMEKYTKHFGLSPKARADLGTVPKNPEKPVDPLKGLRKVS